MNGFSPHLPWLYRQFLHFQRLKGVIWRNYSGIKISHQAKEDFIVLKHLFLQFPVCRWDCGRHRELKMSGWYLLLRAVSTPSSSAVSGLSKETGCPCVFLLLLLKYFGEKDERGVQPPLNNDFHHILCISWGTGLNVAFGNLILETQFSFAPDFGKNMWPRELRSETAVTVEIRWVRSIELKKCSSHIRHVETCWHFLFDFFPFFSEK